MTNNEVLNRLRDFTDAVKIWQLKKEEVHSLELALVQALSKGDYDIKDFAPALSAIHQKSFALDEKITHIIEENIFFIEEEVTKLE